MIWLSRVAPVLIMLSALSLLGVLTLMSVAGGSMDPFASNHLQKAFLALVILCLVSAMPSHIWQQTGYILHIGAIFLLLVVEILGNETKGAARWLDVGFFRLQPSELLKVTTVLAMAQLFKAMPMGHVTNWRSFIGMALLIGLPIILILRQPDLGTSILVVFAAVSCAFIAGMNWRVFAGGFLLLVAVLPVAWHFLKPYQKGRVLTFLDPTRDPTGAGYHILQSQTAIGAGEFWGRGWLGGTQSQLNFLPEKHTDFILSVFAEEFGFLGVFLVLALVFMLVAYGFYLALVGRRLFTRVVAAGISSVMFSYLFVNAGMIAGMLPVVGVPLPFMSFGGTAMITVAFGYGVMLSCHIHEMRQLLESRTFQP